MENKRKYLQKFSQNPEIEYILDKIADDAIGCNDDGLFCCPSAKDLYIYKYDCIEKIFLSIYTKFDFNNAANAWKYFRKWLIQGALTFEIVYDGDMKNIIGFKELDPYSVQPIIKHNSIKWVQYMGDEKNERILNDSQIINISYFNNHSNGKISYAERLVRPYNMLRIAENQVLLSKILPEEEKINSNNTEYFLSKLYQASKIPSLITSPSSEFFDQAKNRYDKMIAKFRNIFIEILSKPIKIQMKLNDNMLDINDINIKFTYF